MADINISDVFGFGKGMEKLIKVISKGTGRVTKAYFERKDIETKAKEIRELAAAKSDAIRILADGVKDTQLGTGGLQVKHKDITVESASKLPEFSEYIELENRMKERVLFQESVKQHNIENITAIAAEQLKNEKEISDVPVEDDWIGRFFNIIEDISSEELQFLWGKILAGEVKRPKSFSLRTLDLVRNLNKEEAALISKIANFAIYSSSHPSEFFMFKEFVEHEYLAYEEKFLMIELGIIQPTNAYWTWEFPPNSTTAFCFGNIHVQIKNSNGNISQMPRSYKSAIYRFTKPGNEILTLIEAFPPFEYVQKFVKVVTRRHHHFKYLKIEHSEIVQKTSRLKDLYE